MGAERTRGRFERAAQQLGAPFEHAVGSQLTLEGLDCGAQPNTGARNVFLYLVWQLAPIIGVGPRWLYPIRRLIHCAFLKLAAVPGGDAVRPLRRSTRLTTDRRHRATRTAYPIERLPAGPVPVSTGSDSLDRIGKATGKTSDAGAINESRDLGDLAHSARLSGGKVILRQ